MSSPKESLSLFPADPPGSTVWPGMGSRRRLSLFPGIRGCFLPVLLLGSMAAYGLISLHGALVAQIPNVAHQELAAALETLTKARLRPEVAGAEISSLPPDLEVSHTIPRAGTGVWKGSAVVLVLERDPAESRVPDLLGLPLEEARNKLRPTTFQLGSVLQVQSTGPPRILAQEPPPGTLIPTRFIEVILSKPPPPLLYVTPDLVGRDQDRVMEKWGWELGRISAIEYRKGSLDNRGKIIEQVPPAGHPLSGTGLKLIVGKGPDLVLYRVVKYQLPQGVQRPVLRIVGLSGKTLEQPVRCEAGASCFAPLPEIPGGTQAQLLDGQRVLLTLGAAPTEAPSPSSDPTPAFPPASGGE